MSHVLRSSGYDLLKDNIVRGEGCYLYDLDDNRYIDFEAGVWCTALGHNHWRVSHVLIKQIDLIGHLGFGYTIPLIEEAAVAVLDTANFTDGRCLFLSSGSEAVELGVQMIRHLTAKPRLLTLANSYLAAYGSAGKKPQEEWYIFDWEHCVSCRYTEDCHLQCDHLQKIPVECIGGLVFEPGSTSGLVKFPPKQLVRKLASIIKEQNGLIMCNEVTTGFGRTGAWYGFEHYDLTPDIIAMGKGMGNGYPVSAVVMNNHLTELLEESPIRYAQSHQNDAYGCAIVKEVIKIIGEQDLIKQGRDVGLKFLNQLGQLEKRYDMIKEVRGRGLMIVIEFFSDDDGVSLSSIRRELFARGFLVGYHPLANLLRFYPPLTIREDDVNALVANLTEILDKGV